MAKNYSNLALKPIDGLKEPSKKSELTFKLESIVRGALRLVPSKRMSEPVGVSTQRISQWIHGERIPEDRYLAILREAKVFLMEQAELEHHIDLALLMQFGTVLS